VEDTDTIEYNSHDPSIEELTRDIAALANSGGGIIRIKEQLSDPVGDPRDTSAIRDKVGRAVSFLSSPAQIAVGTLVDMSQNTRFVNVRVEKSLTPLLVIHSRYYVRQGDTTIRAEEDLTMAFPQVASIANLTLKENIERALPYLTEDFVDIGLLMLGREFENTLKQYLTRAYAKGK
jgi:predicted HTH transcriptional regulator